MKEYKTKYFTTRQEWREWLMANFDKESELWLIFPVKSSGKTCMLYNDAVEEALCFGWIDSTVRAMDKDHKMQRFTPRKNKGYYSQSNKERLRWLLENGLIHESVVEEARRVLKDEFVFPPDILELLKEDETVWANYCGFSDAYKRIRIAYIDVARNRTEEFEKRLANFIKHTRQNILMRGYGGIDKYY